MGTAPHNGLSEFDLGRNLRMPLREPAEDEIPSTDPWYPVWCNDWGITNIHLSTSVLCATVQPRQPSALQRELSRCKEELRTLLRFVANLASEYGLLRPVVGFVLLDACPGTENDGQEEPDWMQHIRGWAGDQDWHRGEFLLFVEADQKEYQKRCLDLLRSVPDLWQEAEGQSPRSAVDILSRALTFGTEQQEARDDDARQLLQSMHRSVQTDPNGAGETENPLAAPFYDWLNQKASAIDERFEVDPPASNEDAPISLAEPIRWRETIARVRKLWITNFRGIGSPGFEFDLDADFLLLAGPNGLGKTSLIEALELLLTSYHHFPESPHDLFHDEACEFELTAEVLLLDNPRPSFITCKGKRKEKNKKEKNKEKKNKEWEKPALEWSVEGNPETSWTMERPLTEEYRNYFGVNLLTPEIAWKTTELLARRTVVYPDRLEKLFDETTQGLTLRDYVEPIPPVVTELLEETDSAIGKLEEWDRTLPVKRTAPDMQASRERVIDALQKLADPYETLAHYSAGLPSVPLPSLPSEEADGLAVDESLSEFVERLLEKAGQSATRDELPGKLLPILQDLHRQTLQDEGGRSEAPTEEDKSATERDKLSDKLRECEDELTRIETEFPWLEEEVAAFDAGGEQPGLLAILETLRDHAVGWSRRWSKGELERQQAPPSVGRVLEELRRVRPEDAAKCAEELRGFLKPRKDAAKKRHDLQAKREHLRAELERASRSPATGALMEIRSELEEAAHTLSHAWSDVRRDQNAQAGAQEAEQKREQLVALQNKVRLVRRLIEKAALPPEELLRNVEKLANTVLSRVVSSGGLRIKLQPDDDDVAQNKSSDATRYGQRRIYTVKTEDRRHRAMLSFGQRTQIGVAMVIAENRLLESKLGHRVFLMDDLSATYDLANLSRDAVFWRQMAYGNGATNEPSQRQVFLSSHHEDLSNRLLDVMAPVEGRRALLYRFTGWKLKTGPSVEVYEVEPQAGLNQGQEDRQIFARWMEAQLTETADAGP